jgi:signal transduction histidine kinase
VLEPALAGPVYARGDEQRVLQIGRILLENALVHTPPGTHVRVSAGLEHGQPTLAVADDGPGIPAEVQPHVFERFYRHAGERASGSGLGLAIARELALLMGGAIAVESRPGRTRFALVLPVDVPERVFEHALA